MPVRKILIVDDSATNRHALTEMLAGTATSAASPRAGKEAIEKAKAEKPDMILMDVVMRTWTLSGDARHHAGRGDQAHPGDLCTSKNLETDRIWGVRQGARDYVLKPVDEKDLLKKITSLR